MDGGRLWPFLCRKKHVDLASIQLQCFLANSILNLLLIFLVP